jgi:sulfite reductase (NADPH) flavoprotein alpha-component
MLEHGAELWRWLESGAYFYVCGDAKKMAPDVDRALQQVAADHGRCSAAEAKSWVQNLVKQKRYLKDVY